MLIGELAQRLRVTPRTLRHYESLGLLVPSSIDPRTGYRSYGADAVARGMQIEQLKVAGLSLGEIGSVLNGGESLAVVLARQRQALATEVHTAQRRLAMIDALLEPQRVAGPERVTMPATAVDSVVVTTPVDEIGSTIRRHVQRLRRRHPSCVFAARFPLDFDECVDVEITALGEGPGQWDAYEAVRVEIVGPYELLPVAYDTALAAAEDRHAALTGVVQETYYEIGPVPRTAIDVLIRT